MDRNVAKTGTVVKSRHIPLVWGDGQLFRLVEIMKAFQGAEFGEIIQDFTKVETYHPVPGLEQLVAGSDSEPVKFLLNNARDHCLASGLKVSAKTFEELLLHIDRGAVKWGQLQQRLGEAVNTMRRELSTILLFSIAPEREDYFTNVQPFGKLVAAAFPEVGFDVEEAAKCLALDRGTATVFHLMRVMEEGLKYVASLLGIPYAPSWESYISQISTRVADKHDHKSVDWKRDESFFKGILGDLEAIKIAWRNPTMHIVRNYSDSEAEDVFKAVKTLMLELAARKIASMTPTT
jgi:hypothetical protein